MTCIIGIAQEGKVWIGGDSMASNGWNRHATALRKVFRVGQFLIGYTSSFRMGQILQYHLEVRHQQDGESDERYMVVAFVEAARQCLKDKGFTEVSNNREEGGQFLVGYKDVLYQIDSDFQVNHYLNGIAAVGAGDAYALGALLALNDMLPEERILKSLEISAQLSKSVCPPFYVECQA